MGIAYVKAVSVTACIAATSQSGLSEESQPSSAGQAHTRKAIESQRLADGPGMKVYIDPQTGEFVSEPPPNAGPLELSPAERNAFSSSHQGLIQVPGAVPGGGVKLDLQGRFQSPLTATVAPDGRVLIEHKRLDASPSDK
jgi:hypothetical protein